jgi:hypothetical protein
MSSHRVYQIYGPAKNGGSRVYKYGLTKNEDLRPRRQLRRCTRMFGADCDYSWVRKDIDGWYRARKVEAGYATKYKIRFGNCPPGMRKCL